MRIASELEGINTYTMILEVSDLMRQHKNTDFPKNIKACRSQDSVAKVFKEFKTSPAYKLGAGQTVYK